MSDSEEPKLRYRILRYLPNLMRDEWVNIGVLIEDPDAARYSMRIVEEPSEIARVRRLHPSADENLLRQLAGDFDGILRSADVVKRIEELNRTSSTTLQFSPLKGVFAADLEAELERVYREQVAPPSRTRVGIVESARGWIKARLDDVLRRHRVPGLERRIRVEEFTEPGDSFKLDYAYRNGVRGFLHAVAIGRDPVQAKVLAYTAGRVRARINHCEFTAITEAEPEPGNRRHAFISRLFEDNRISVVPLNRVEKFAEELRQRLQ